MSGHLPRENHKRVRDYSTSHGGISLSTPSSVLLARVAGVCVHVTPSHDDPNGVEEGTPFVFFFNLFFSSF